MRPGWGQIGWMIVLLGAAGGCAPTQYDYPTAVGTFSGDFTDAGGTVLGTIDVETTSPILLDRVILTFEATDTSPERIVTLEGPVPIEELEARTFDLEATLEDGAWTVSGEFSVLADQEDSSEATRCAGELTAAGASGSPYTFDLPFTSGGLDDPTE